MEQTAGKLKLGVDLVKADRLAEGRLVLDEVLEDDPQNSIAWLWSGMAAAKMDDWGLAEIKL